MEIHKQLACIYCCEYGVLGGGGDSYAIRHFYVIIDHHNATSRDSPQFVTLSA